MPVGALSYIIYADQAIASRVPRYAGDIHIGMTENALAELICSEIVFIKCRGATGVI